MPSIQSICWFVILPTKTWNYTTIFSWSEINNESLLKIRENIWNRQMNLVSWLILLKRTILVIFSIISLAQCEAMNKKKLIMRGHFSSLLIYNLYNNRIVYVHPVPVKVLSRKDFSIPFFTSLFSWSDLIASLTKFYLMITPHSVHYFILI